MTRSQCRSDIGVWALLGQGLQDIFSVQCVMGADWVLLVGCMLLSCSSSRRCYSRSLYLKLLDRVLLNISSSLYHAHICWMKTWYVQDVMSSAGHTGEDASVTFQQSSPRYWTRAAARVSWGFICHHCPRWMLFIALPCAPVLAEVVVCAVGRVVTLPAVEITAQATALLVLGGAADGNNSGGLLVSSLPES